MRVVIEASFSSSLSRALLWLHFCVSDKFKAHKLEKAEQITSAQQCGAVQLLSEDKPAWQLALFYPFWCEMLLPGSASNAAFWSNTLRQFYRQQIKTCIFFGTLFATVSQNLLLCWIYFAASFCFGCFLLQSFSNKKEIVEKRFFQQQFK